LKKQLKEDAAKTLGGDNELKEKEKKIAKLEHMFGQKEVEITLLKNFFGRELTTDEKVRLVDQHKKERGLNRCLRATELSYAEGARTAHLMAVVDVGSRCALGWAVAASSPCGAGSRCALAWRGWASRWKEAYCTATSTASTPATTGYGRFCSTMARA